MNKTFCKNCGSLLEDSSKGHFCSKSCKRKYRSKKVLFWGGVTVGAGLLGYGAWKGGPKIYNWFETNLNTPKKIPSQSVPLLIQNTPKPCVSVLDKCSIVASLNNRGYDVKNVRALNPILEEMGVLKRIGKDWVVTDYGLQYSIYKGHTVNEATGFRSTLIDAVQEYLDKKGK